MNKKEIELRDFEMHFKNIICFLIEPVLMT